jgi:hypothetical protein
MEISSMGSKYRIDFLGPSGVGKSTLYKELLQQRRKNDRWMTPKEVQVKIAQRISCRHTNSIDSYTRAVFLNNPLFKPIHPVLTETILSKYEYKYLALWEKPEEEEAINNFIAAMVSLKFPPFFKLHRLNRIFEFARKVALFQKHGPDQTTVLIDDSLTNEIPFLGPWNSENDLKNLGSYFHALGDLSGVIFLDADDHIVVERLKKRMELFVNIAHQRMNILEVMEDTRRRLQSARQLSNMLEARGIPVVRVNSGDALDNQVRLVKDFLRGYP